MHKCLLVSNAIGIGGTYSAEYVNMVTSHCCCVIIPTREVDTVAMVGGVLSTLDWRIWKKLETYWNIIIVAKIYTQQDMGNSVLCLSNDNVIVSLVKKSSCHERHTHRTISTNDERTIIDERYRTHRTISTNEHDWIKMSDGIDVLKKSTSPPSRFHGVVYSVSRLFPAEILLLRLVENFNSHLLGVRTLRH